MLLIRTIAQTTALPSSGWTADGIRINLFLAPRCSARHAFVVWTLPCKHSGAHDPVHVPQKSVYGTGVSGDQRFGHSLADIYCCNVELNAISGPPPSVMTRRRKSLRRLDRLRRAVMRPHAAQHLHRRQTFINVGFSTSTHRCAMSSNTLRLYQPAVPSTTLDTGLGEGSPAFQHLLGGGSTSMRCPQPHALCWYIRNGSA
jgi:hypothetical protein